MKDIFKDMCEELLELADDRYSLIMPGECSEGVREIVRRYREMAEKEAEADHIIDTYPGY